MVGLDNISVASHKTNLTSTTVSTIRSTGNKNFITSYEAYCNKSNTHPLKDVKVANSYVRGSLELVVDKIKFIDWVPLLRAVSNDRSLHSIAFKSRILQGNISQDIITETQVREMKRGPILFTACMLQKLTDASVNCLKHSKTLRMFHLEKIPLLSESIVAMSQGISKTCSLQKIILVGCHLGDQGCKDITEAIKFVPSIRVLDLSLNDISAKGAQYIAELIKFQDIRRYNECWKHSLRSREVNNEAIPGLRRFTVNDNHEIRDKGLKYIVEALCDDYWIKAIDMQNCGITDRGSIMIEKLLESNNDIVVFDIRRNDIINVTAVASIIATLGARTKENDNSEFGWMDMSAPLIVSSEDSSSGGASCSSYTLALANEKVANYVENTAGHRHNQLRGIHSATTFTINSKRSSRQDTHFLKPLQRSLSTTTRKPYTHRNINSIAGESFKKIATSAASVHDLIKTNIQTSSVKPVKSGPMTSTWEPHRQSSVDCVSQSNRKVSNLRSSRSVDQVPTGSGPKSTRKNIHKTEYPIMPAINKLEINKSESNLNAKDTNIDETDRSVDNESELLEEERKGVAMSVKIECELQKLLKSFEHQTEDTAQSQSLIHQFSLDDGNAVCVQPNERYNCSRYFGHKTTDIKEKVSGMYFNRLDDDGGE